MKPRCTRSAVWGAVRWAAMVGILSLAPGCVRATTSAGPSTVVAGVWSAGLDLNDPLALSPAVVAEVSRALESVPTRHERLRALRDLLYVKADQPFSYAPHVTLTAERAYHERRGDCMAFSMLFASLARAVGLDVYFVHVRDVESYYERGGELFVSSHVAVGDGVGPNARIYDFKKEITDWKLSIYRRIDDEAARALYYNNVAVDWMLAGRYDEAKRLFSVLLERASSVAEPYNNYGVLLLRRRENDEALRVLLSGIDKWGSYKPLYTNAIAAADALGEAATVARLEAEVQKLTHEDPIYVFGRGMRFLSKGAYPAAVDELSRARDAMPESAVVLAGLGRALVGAGRVEEGVELLEKARLKADAPLRRELEDKLEKARDLRGRPEARRDGR